MWRAINYILSTGDTGLVGGGSNNKSGCRKKELRRGDSTVPLYVPLCFGTVMMGLGGVWVGVWCCYPDPSTNPQPLICFYLHVLMEDFCAFFGEGGDSLAGPQRRVCSAGWSRLMTVCFRKCVYLTNGFLSASLTHFLLYSNFEWKLNRMKYLATNYKVSSVNQDAVLSI